jgi:hypothetical protein
VGLELRPARAESASSEEPLRVEATEGGPSFELRVETQDGPQAPRAQSVNAPRAEGPRPTPLLDQVQVVLGPELSEARIRLDPPGLGNLFVQVKELKGELSAQIEVERPEVLREIERLLPQLQDSFQRNGQTVTRIEVSLRPDGFAADAHGGGRHSGDAHDAHDSGAAPAPHRSPTPAEPRRAATLRLAPRGGLDTLA